MVYIQWLHSSCMATTISIVGLVLLVGLLAGKSPKKDVKSEEIDLSFLGQMTLFGASAVEWVKNGTNVFTTHLIHGKIGDLLEIFEINIEVLRLTVENEVFLLFEEGRDRPVLVYQKSAMAQVYRWLSEINVNGGIIDVRPEYLGNTKQKIGTRMVLDLDCADRQLEFSREKGKFGKYILEF